MDTRRSSPAALAVIAALALAPRGAWAQSASPSASAPTRITTTLPREAHELSTRLEAPREREADPRVICRRGQGRGFERSTAFYDRTSRRWLVIDVDREPGAAARVAWFGTATEGADEALTTAAPAREVCQGLRNSMDLAYTPNLVTAEATRTNALGASVPLVRAGSWLVYVGRSDDASDAVYAFRPDRSQRWRLATRASFVAPAPRRAPPAAAAQGAYQWLGVTAVRRAPDGSSLLVQGYRGPAETRGAGAFHWVIPLRGAEVPFAAAP